MNLSKPVVLIGPMGVGKTTIGKKLAKLLETTFLDTDQLVAKKYGEIQEIFKSVGEAKFREYESEELKAALRSPCVIATGGGVILIPENRLAMKESFVVYLSTNGKHIRSRISGGNRPLLENGFADWQRIYDERKPIYESVADIIIDTSSIGLKEIINEICEKLETL